MFRRFRKWPSTAHGRRNIDGSYFSIWHCPNGHGRVGGPGSPPERGCLTCTFDAVKADRSMEPFAWTLCTPLEARDFLFELEDFGMYSGVGFTLSDAVRDA